MANSPRTIYLLRQTQLLVYAAMIERLKALDLTPAQYMVLSLSGNEDRLSSADLARRSHITPQSMNEIIGALHRKGLIRRQQNPQNRRILSLALTKDGARVLTECDRQIDRMEADIFRCLTGKQQASFRALHLKLLRQSLQKGGEAIYVDEKSSSIHRAV